MDDSLAEFAIDERIRQATTTIQSIPEPIVAIEAYWDGDTSGWYVRLGALGDTFSPEQQRTAPAHPHAHDDSYRHPRYREYPLYALQGSGGDLRLFNTQISSWPEGQAALLIGSQLAEHFQVPFHFVSPQEPDDDCPRWWQQHLARPCQHCQKPIVPPTSPYRQAHLCSACERRLRLRSTE